MEGARGMKKITRSWTQKRDRKLEKLERINSLLDGKFVDTSCIVEVMEALIEPGSKVILEGDNQKQASFLSQKLVEVNPSKVHELHMIMSSISRPEHLDIFD